MDVKYNLTFEINSIVHPTSSIYALFLSFPRAKPMGNEGTPIYLYIL